ncbi:hypothetical protein ENBRE01_2981 [Enteropsectra breve]|nr:hypothetical protein ENBRE01_2981 [Enteropsectra breve]
MLKILTLLAALISAEVHFNPNCADCQNGKHKQTNPGKDGTNAVRINDVARTSDGENVSLAPDNSLNRAPNGNDLVDELENKKDQINDLHQDAAHSKEELLKLQQKSAEEQAHAAEHKKDHLRKRALKLEREKNKELQIFSKEVVPVTVFPKHLEPFEHHRVVWTKKKNEIRTNQDKLFLAQKNVVLVYNTTDLLKAANPGSRGPQDYTNLMLDLHNDRPFKRARSKL